MVKIVLSLVIIMHFFSETCLCCADMFSEWFNPEIPGARYFFLYFKGCLHFIFFNYLDLIAAPTNKPVIILLQIYK
jgi:hypothetical protein